MNNQEILLKTLQKENELIIKNYTEKYNQLNEKYKQEKEKNERLLEENEKTRKQLDSILYSRSYKAMQKVKKMLGR